MKVLAITGGIGGGKSYVTRIFSALGVPIYLSDDRAKMLYEVDKGLLNDVIELLGDSIVENGVLQRRVMASIIFSDKDLLAKVEALVFPAVLRDFERWKSAQCSENGTQFVIFESAIFLEKPLFKADKVLTISAPREIRIERIMSRDNMNIEEIERRIDNQCADSEREKMSDYVICSDGKSALLPQVLEIFDRMNEL